MKKKQIIGLGTLLLVLLLGSFTTSYAMSVSQAEDCMQYITDQYNANYTPYYKVCVPALIDSNLWAQHKSEIGFDTYNTIIMRCLYESAKVYVDFVTLDTDNTYINNAFIQFNTNNATISNVRVCRFIMSRTGVVSSYQLTTKNLDYNSLIRNPTDQSVWCAAVIQANNIVNTTDYFYFGKGYSSQIPLTFIPKLTDTYADVWTYEDVPFYNASGEDLYLGQLFVPIDYQGYKTSTIFYWQYGNWQFKELTDYASYLVYVDSENDTSVYDVYLLREYINDNMLYDITFTDTTTEPLYTLAKCVFYIKNNYTIITNGVLDTPNTFSGDYKDKYDNDLQNEQDINNISEAITGTILDSSEVDTILGQYDTSGELKEVLGYHDINSDTSSSFYEPNLLITHTLNEILDECMRSGDNYYFDVSLHGESPTRIHARYFKTPENALTLTVKWFLIFGSIYCLYKYAVDVGETLTTLNFFEVSDKIDTDRYIYRM